MGSVWEESSFTPHLCRCVGCDRVVARGGTVPELRLPTPSLIPLRKAKPRLCQVFFLPVAGQRDFSPWHRLGTPGSVVPWWDRCHP